MSSRQIFGARDFGATNVKGAQLKLAVTESKAWPRFTMVRA
jgi:hypothetical protein